MSPRAAIILVLLATAATASGDRRDPPAFESDYAPPPTFASPQPRPWSHAMEVVDFAVLAGAMALGAVLVLTYRRRWAIALVMVGALLYLGFFRLGCLCPIGAIQNVGEGIAGEIHVSIDGDKLAAVHAGAALPSEREGEFASAREYRARLADATDGDAREAFRAKLGRLETRFITDTDAGFALSLSRSGWNRQVLNEILADELPAAAPDASGLTVGDICRVETRFGALPWLVVGIFALPLVMALLFGRVFCGSACPLGAMQDVMLIRPIRVPRWLERALRMLAAAYLAVAVLLAVTGTLYLICAYDPFVSVFRIVPVGKWLRWGAQGGDPSGGAGLLAGGTGRWALLLLPVSFLVIAMFVGRPYCRFLCPYGVLLRPLSRLSWRHARITPDECVRCRLCEDACPYGAIRAPTPPHKPSGWDRRRLGVVLAALPLIVAAGAAGGWALGEPLARAHLKLRLSDRLEAERIVHEADAAAMPLPAAVDGRTLDAGSESDDLWATRGVEGGEGVWRTRLLAFESDAVARVDAPNIRVAVSREQGRPAAVFIVPWTRRTATDGWEQLRTLFVLAMDDGELLRREDLSATYDPAEAFARRRFVSAGAGGQDNKRAQLDRDTAAIRRQFRWGGLIVGVVLACVVGMELVSLSVTRRRDDYEIDKGDCLSCGRCFKACPREQFRRRTRKDGGA